MAASANTGGIGLEILTMTVKLDGTDVLADALEAVQGSDAHVILEREGRPVAAVISLRDLNLLDEYIEALEDAVDRVEIARARQEGGRTYSLDEVMREAGIV